MRHWTLSGAIGAAILSSSSGFARPAQDIVAGIYELDEGPIDNAFKAIDRGIADLPDAKRPLARTRLRKSVAVSRIRISLAGSRLGVAYDAKTPIVVWLGQEPVRWKLIEELVFYVTARSNGDGVSLTFHGDDSDRTTTYRNVGRNLMENTTITGPMLSMPIVYENVYKRVN